MLVHRRFHDTVVNGVPAAGGSGLDFEFTGTDQYLSIASNATLQVADVDFTVSARIKLESKTGVNQFFAGKMDGSSGAQEYGLYFNEPNNRMWWFVSKADGLHFEQIAANTLGAVSTGIWYVVTAGHDSVNNKVWIKVNETARDETPYAFGSNAGASQFRIGIDAGTLWQLDGIVDWVGWWKGRSLSDADHALLYNGGATITYNALDASLLTNLTSWWDLSDAVSPSDDAVTTNNLTWVGSPTPTTF